MYILNNALRICPDLAKGMGKEREKKSKSQSGQGTASGITRRVPPIGGIRIKERKKRKEKNEKKKREKKEKHPKKFFN